MKRSIVFVLLLTSALSAQSALIPDFDTSWVGYDTGNGDLDRWPWAGRVGDLDNDGDMDIVTVSWWFYSNLSVMLNDGSGRYAQPQQYEFGPTVTGSSLDVELADISGDGFLDAVVSKSGSSFEGNSIALLVNNGDGTFQPPQSFAVAGGGLPGVLGLATADFSGDGLPDVAAALYGWMGQGSTVVLLVNDGAGGFLPKQSFPAGAGPYKLAAGDLDGDGLPDLAVARGQQAISILMNRGSGFAAPVSYTTLDASNALPAIALGDVDNDGDLDVVSGGMTPALFRNQGDGTLTPPETLLEGAGTTQSLAIGDITGDGWADILSAQGGSSHWTLMRGDGTGGFLPGETVAATMDPSEVRVADVDGDGGLDAVVIGRGSLEVAIYLDGGAVAPPPSTFLAFASTPSFAESMDGGDIDGDGDLDVAVAYKTLAGDGGIMILRNRGDGSFHSPVNYSSQEAQAAKLRDLDGDGDLDLIWSDDSPPFDMHTRKNDGTGVFGPAVLWPLFTCRNVGMDAFDVDGDGDCDALVLEGICGGNVHISLNNGNGAFAAAYTLPTDTSVRDIVGADLNGDGLMDLATVSPGIVRVFHGTGGGAFTLFQIASGGGINICASDLDGDGILDLATTTLSGGGDAGPPGTDVPGMRVYIGRPDGSFKLPSFYAGSYGLSPTQIADGDVDADGDTDLMMSNYSSHDVSFFRNQGDGTFETQVRYGAWDTPTDLLAADFTGDGGIDLCVAMGVGPSPFINLSVGVIAGLRAPGAWANLGNGLAGSFGAPALVGTGTLVAGDAISFALSGALASTPTTLVIGFAQLNAPFKGGVLVPDPAALIGGLVTDVVGNFVLAGTWPPGVPAGFPTYYQYWLIDPAGSEGFAASNAILGTTP